MNLPDKLSELILVALEDLEACEADPKYKINMDVWYEPKGKRCHVCFAGAVMANKAPKVNLSAGLGPEFFGAEEDKFLALEEIRRGNFEGAISLLYKKHPKEFGLPSDFNETHEPGIGRFSYKRNLPKWKRYMQDIAGILAEDMNLGELEFRETDIPPLIRATKEDLAKHVNQRLKEKLEKAPVVYGDYVNGRWVCDSLSCDEHGVYKCKLICMEQVNQDSMEKLIEDIASIDLGDDRILDNIIERARKLRGE